MMSVQVGLHPYLGQLLCYNEDTKCTDYFQITAVQHRDYEKISSMFEEIISHINGTPGYICICCDSYYLNKFRKKLIEEGLKHGFKNVQIINDTTALYLNVMAQIDYKPLDGDVIWINRYNRIYVWQIKNQKATFIGEWNAEDIKRIQNDIVIKKNIKRGPNIVFHHDDIDKSEFILISLECKFYTYKNENTFERHGSLIKAQIASGNSKFAHLNTFALLDRNMALILGRKGIAHFRPLHQLPIIYSQKLVKLLDSDALRIVSKQWQEESLQLPNWKEIYLTFKIDTNEIYSVNFEKQPKNENLHRDDEQFTSKQTSLNEIDERTILTSNSVQNLDNGVTKNYSIPKITTQFDTNINAVGIDLGTSRCCLAVSRKNGIITVALDNTGERLLPSYVAFDEEMPICGSIVIERLRNYSSSTVYDSKRIIGRKFGEIEIDTFWPFELSEMDGKVNLGIKKFTGKGFVSAEEVSGTLLKQIKQKAEEFQGKKLTDAVITIPTAFHEAQNEATLEAAKIAGWENVTLLPEPIAAAFAYFMDRPIPNNSNLLLFDLGGGTLDVCIFKIENNEIRIISNSGDTKLGGRDFDTILINYFKNALIAKHGINVANKKKYLLMIKCQKIKESLSLLQSGSLDIDDFDPSQDGIITIDRKEFQKMAEPLLNKIKNTIQSALFRSKYDPKQINKVLQVGGGSRMPMIKDLLKEIFPVSEHLCEEHPDEVVAIGAAYYAYSLSSKSQ